MESKLDLSSITLTAPEDTITLSGSSGYTYANTIVGGAVPNISISSGTATSYPYVTTTGINYPTWGNPASAKIKLEGPEADIEINGESFGGMLKDIRDRLNLLQPNPEMEKEWDQLRELGEQYRALEAKLREQGEMWARLKAMPPPDIR